jgi:lipopolysaccharide export system protein LptA
MQPAKHLLLGCALWLMCLPLPVCALSSDRDQPINIEADSATLHEKSGNSTYRGNVHLRQGTLHLHGDTMTVEMRDDRIEKIVLVGSPATYVQRPDNSDEDQHAEARRVEYYATDERLILLENARIWRSGDEEFSSERIIFNLADNTVNAGGGSSSDRVRITLPSRKSGKPKPAPETEPATEPEPATKPEPATEPDPVPDEIPSTDIAP